MGTSNESETKYTTKKLTEIRPGEGLIVIRYYVVLTLILSEVTQDTQEGHLKSLGL